MPKYQMYFDTIQGDIKFNVDIDEEETLDQVLEEILYDLRERGHILQGEGTPEVTWSGRTLDFGTGLPRQGVRPNDVLRVATVATNG